jgi:hypothetical protein
MNSLGTNSVERITSAESCISLKNGLVFFNTILSHPAYCRRLCQLPFQEEIGDHGLVFNYQLRKAVRKQKRYQTPASRWVPRESRERLNNGRRSASKLKPRALRFKVSFRQAGINVSEATGTPERLIHLIKTPTKTMTTKQMNWRRCLV